MSKKNKDEPLYIFIDKKGNEINPKLIKKNKNYQIVYNPNF